jgi:coenzyme PQQ synthesis protein D (PqqD)
MFITSKTIRSAPSQDGTVLLDVHQGRMFSLNPMGSKILDLLKEGRDEAQIADEIVRTYGIAIEMARTDVHEFLQALCAHRIVIAIAGSQNRA